MYFMVDPPPSWPQAFQTKVRRSLGSAPRKKIVAAARRTPTAPCHELERQHW